RHRVPPVEMETTYALVRQKDIRCEPCARLASPHEPGHIRGRQTVCEIVPRSIRREVAEAETCEAETLEERCQREPCRQPHDDARALEVFKLTVTHRCHRPNLTTARPRPHHRRPRARGGQRWPRIVDARHASGLASL